LVSTLKLELLLLLYESVTVKPLVDGVPEYEVPAESV
jgi:hypothetical protein